MGGGGKERLTNGRRAGKKGEINMKVLALNVNGMNEATKSKEFIGTVWNERSGF